MGTMDKIRQESHADYETAKADLELGLNGVRQAVVTLRNYYGGAAAMLQDDSKFGAFLEQPAAPETFSKAQGGGESIINILEVCESDFASNLAKAETYAARAERRAAEIAGLKEALSILEDETALVQRKKRSFRGTM